MNDKRLTLLVFSGTFFALYILDFLMNTDILSFVTFHKHGSTISFVGALLCLIISTTIIYAIQSYKKKKR